MNVSKYAVGFFVLCVIVFVGAIVVVAPGGAWSMSNMGVLEWLDSPVSRLKIWELLMIVWLMIVVMTTSK